MLAIGLLIALPGCANWRALPRAPSADLPALGAQATGETPLAIIGPRGRVNRVVRDRITQQLAALGADNLLGRQLAAMQAVSSGPIIAGNDVRLLIDGPEAYAAMFDAITAAKVRIDVEMFIFDEAHRGSQPLSDLLVRKAGEGVAIRVLYDALGSRDSPDALFQKLRDAGVRTCAFNPLIPVAGRKTVLTQRDHRKIVVADGTVAFAGGINFSGAYSSGSRSQRYRVTDAIRQGWRDTQVRVEGPATNEVQRLFNESWEKQNCPQLAALPEVTAARVAGSMLLRINASSVDSRRNETYVAALSAVSFATKSIDLTMAYFAPDVQLEDALRDATQRGVRVRLLLPGFSDFGGILYAGRAHYAVLLASGVEIFEERRALLHAKTMSVDGVWSTVGSANWDWISFASNDELNVVIIDAGFATQMQRMFESDLAGATPILLRDWRRRSLKQRILERFWRTWQRFL